MYIYIYIYAHVRLHSAWVHSITSYDAPCYIQDLVSPRFDTFCRRTKRGGSPPIAAKGALRPQNSAGKNQPLPLPLSDHDIQTRYELNMNYMLLLHSALDRSKASAVIWHVFATVASCTSNYHHAALDGSALRRAKNAQRPPERTASITAQSFTSQRLS